MTGLIGKRKIGIPIKADPEFNKMVEKLQEEVRRTKGINITKRDVTFLLAEGFKSSKFKLKFDARIFNDDKKKRDTGLV